MCALMSRMMRLGHYFWFSSVPAALLLVGMMSGRGCHADSNSRGQSEIDSGALWRDACGTEEGEDCMLWPRARAKHISDPDVKHWRRRIRQFLKKERPYPEGARKGW